MASSYPFDFIELTTKLNKNGTLDAYWSFIVKRSKDIMIRGGAFYALWDDSTQRWNSDEFEAIGLLDTQLDIWVEEHKEELLKDDVRKIRILHLKNSENRRIDAWKRYCQKDMSDNFHMLDEKIIFLNDKVSKKDYASKRVEYELKPMDIPAYDKLMSVLYSDEERHKIEWAIGAIVNGDSKTIQKFLVLYGASGTGKSTVLNIIQMLFDGYYSTFDAKALGSSSNSFALEAFRTNPLVAIQHDGDLSRIEDNTRLNSLVSHELMTVNEKFKSTYTNRFKSFLFMGTNKPVKITDAKSGLIRRLIDVTPTGKLVPTSEYKKLIKQISFELGGIAYHCKTVYEDDPGYYDNYIPETMIGASNDFYNFILDKYFEFTRENYISLNTAWEMYKSYCEEAKVQYSLSKRAFKEELKNYFEDFTERVYSDDGTRIRSVYKNFKTELFERKPIESQTTAESWLSFKVQPSILDKVLADCSAQYAKKDGTPRYSWDNVRTKLADLDTSKLHFVRPPENHIFIDFDLTDENGNKSLERNIEAASKFPETYAELSKSGSGIHLHYIYNGDASKLDKIYSEHIEIKVCSGKGSLRRKLSTCNDHDITTISSGLPLRKETKIVNEKKVKDLKNLQNLVKKIIHKECCPGTKPSVEFLKKVLDDTYNAGEITYDISDMYDIIFDFAANSTHHASYCLGLLTDMHFKSKDLEEQFMYGDNFAETEKSDDRLPLVIYDVEVYPNFFLICWKELDVDLPVNAMVNPTSDDVIDFCKSYRLIDYNGKRYDRIILHGRMKAKNNEELHLLSKDIISNKKIDIDDMARNIGYLDLYDCASKKQSLKKWEVELKKTHVEVEFPWDEPLPEDKWDEVISYCKNDVLATEAVYHAIEADIKAREILAEMAGMSIDTSTNALTTRIIFGKERHPQSSFNYRNMAYNSDHYLFDDKWTCFDKNERPVFPNYIYDKYKKGKEKSFYRGEDIGEGGYVYAEPGVYYNVALLDIASMHPSSIIAEQLFGPYTKNFENIVKARIAIKHKQFDEAKKLLGEKAAKYLDDPEQAKQLAQALKIAINSVYGLTAASFPNPFKDPRNEDNIVAKRGALFMVNLKHRVQEMGFTVAHIKTDSIKIPNATPEIIKFVMDYGKMYGYTFEHEATYDKMCLVNNAVYIAKHDGIWDAVGTQFQVPYVFKTMFSKEPIEFYDMCELKSVTGDSALYLDMNENLPKDEHNYHFIGRVGSFCPIKDGCGGGLLYRYKDGKYYSAAGTSQTWVDPETGKKVKKTYRWLQSDTAKVLNLPVATEYYDHLVDEAKATISQYTDVDEFCKD